MQFVVKMETAEIAKSTANGFYYGDNSGLLVRAQGSLLKIETTPQVDAMVDMFTAIEKAIRAVVNAIRRGVPGLHHAS